MADTSIWRLVVGGNKYLGLIPHDLGYFNLNFTGQDMPYDWVPPPINIDGKSKKLPDFISWMKGAPVVSERVVSTLSSALGNCVQFLNFHEIKNKKYYAMNVTCVETDLLDERKSEIFFSSSEPKQVLSLDKAVFVVPIPSLLAPIFKVAISGEVMGDIFVTKSFADLVVQHQFTGIALTDPSVDPLDLALAQKSGNVVPGVAG